MEIEIVIPNWPLSNKVKAFTTSRQGGQSSAPYDSFNLAHHVGDNVENVKANRDFLVSYFDLPENPLWVNQVSGASVLEIPVAPQLVNDYYKVVLSSDFKASKKKENEALMELFTVDALYTKEVDTVCAILTADCVPILLCNEKETEISAVHAGWQGLVKGIVQNAVYNMETMKEPKEDDFLYAWIGPAIGPESFVVGSEVMMKFCELDPDFSEYFKPYIHEENKWLGDLPSIAALILEKCGLKRENIYFSKIDTKTNPNYYSYRRDNKTGRMATLIWLDCPKRIEAEKAKKAELII